MDVFDSADCDSFTTEGLIYRECYLVKTDQANAEDITCAYKCIGIPKTTQRTFIRFNRIRHIRVDYSDIALYDITLSAET